MEYQLFKREMKESFNLDLDGYKEKQLQRRLNAIMNRFEVDDFRSLLSLLFEDRSSYDTFI
ncbi:MAG TPA: chemotaxis protein CheR, partial [Clostridia bacterium]|nr:chemotaxis protein CheR [Clostridia bacterium]